jgi:hypothetical protein
MTLAVVKYGNPAIRNGAPRTATRSADWDG